MKGIFFSFLFIYSAYAFCGSRDFYDEDNFDLKRLESFEIEDADDSALKDEINDYILKKFEYEYSMDARRIAIPTKLPKHELDLSFFDRLDQENPVESIIRKVLFRFFPQHLQQDFLPNSAQIKRVEIISILKGNDLIPYLGSRSFYVYNYGYNHEIETITFKLKVYNSHRRWLMETDRIAGKYLSQTFPNTFDDDEPIYITITYAPYAGYFGPSIVNVHSEYMYWEKDLVGHEINSRSETVFRLEDIESF